MSAKILQTESGLVCLTPLQEYVLACLSSIQKMRISFTAGLGHAHMEAEIHRNIIEPDSQWTVKLRVKSNSPKVKVAEKTVALSDELGTGWIKRLVRYLPNITGHERSDNSRVRITCEVHLPGTQVTVSSFGIANDSQIYCELVDIAFSAFSDPNVYSAEIYSSVRDGGSFFGNPKNAIALEARENPHAKSQEFAEVNLAGVRIRLPWGIKWSRKDSVISKALLKKSVSVIAKINGQRFGLYTKSGRYDGIGNSYTPIIECMEDLTYVQDLIRLVKQQSPIPCLIS